MQSESVATAVSNRSSGSGNGPLGDVDPDAGADHLYGRPVRLSEQRLSTLAESRAFARGYSNRVLSAAWK
jgi:hypothetical protein